MDKPKRCIDCRFYPDECGYWDNKKGIFIDGNVGRLKNDAEHNCQDFQLLCPAVKKLMKERSKSDESL